jgi:MFS family permease
MVATAHGMIKGKAELWNRGYEFKAVALMALGLGVVGLDRFIINPLFPVIQKDLGLSYQDLGLISAVLALTWGAASIFSGRIADRLGHKPVMVVATLLFSALVATTGLATGLISLLVIRAVMGVAEGSFLPASIVATVEASKPSRVGLNVGIQQMAQPLFGLGLGPVVAVGLLKFVPNWHWVFAIAAIPGLIVAGLIAVVIRHDPPRSRADHTQEKSVGFLLALGNRNVIFSVLAMCCFLTALITLAAFAPNYLTDHLKLTLDQMGVVLAGQGLGSFIGMVAVPAISDRLGRKPVMIAALIIAFVALVALMNLGASILPLFATMFISTGMIAGAVAINVGPLTSASVPPAIAATATGLVVGVGEIVGGAVAPAIAGGLADTMGIPIILKIATIAIGLAVLVVAFGVREPKRA